MATGKQQAAFFIWISISLCIAKGIGKSSFECNSSGYTEGVITQSGPVRGKEITVLGEAVEVYLGIPYAQPPLGELRFKNPAPVEPWRDVLLATRAPDSCPQELVYPPYFDEWNTKAPLSEDCLFLNIWVPKKLRSSGNASTLIWIHGGGYFTGASTLEQYDGAYLAVSNDIIVASMNYRVGALGFLHLGIEDAPGNMGLFDQHLAIRWIKENIGLFGGNPDSLTLFGESAGGGSASYHLLSPTSKNLTRRFIMQSGTANTPWSFKTSQEARKLAFELADMLGCRISSNDSNGALEIVKCLRTMPAKNITVEQDKLIKLGMDLPFAPTVDGAFLPKSPSQLLEEGGFEDIEAIIGTTKDEGSMFVAYEQYRFFNEHSEPALSKEQQNNIVKMTFSNSGLHEIEEDLILHQYTDWERCGSENANAKMVVHLFGDYFFICPTVFFAQKIKEGGAKVFYYSFHQEKSVRKLGTWMGASHTDDIEFVFGAPLSSSKNYTDGERLLSQRMMNYFSSFAKNGRPSLNETEWPEYSNERQYFIILHENGNKLSLNGPRATACSFWNNLTPKIRNALAEQEECVLPEMTERKDAEGKAPSEKKE